MTDPSHEAGGVGEAPAVADLLTHPAVSHAPKDVLLVPEVRDPVDAVRNARLLTEVLERRADEAVSWGS